MNRPIKLMQPRLNKKGEFLFWFYWGYTEEGEASFTSPLDKYNGGDSFQFTGLFDKDGKEIYEGHIVKEDMLADHLRVLWVKDGYFIADGLGPNLRLSGFAKNKLVDGTLKIIGHIAEEGKDE